MKIVSQATPTVAVEVIFENSEYYPAKRQTPVKCPNASNNRNWSKCRKMYERKKLASTVIQIVTAVIFLTPIRAQAGTLIDFETFPNGSAVPGGAQITLQYASWGVIFGSVPVSGASQVTTIINYVPTVS